MKKIAIALSVFGLLACKQQKISLKLLNEYVVKDSLQIDNTVIGGISGIDYYNNQYYIFDQGGVISSKNFTKALNKFFGLCGYTDDKYLISRRDLENPFSSAPELQHSHFIPFDNCEIIRPR